MFYVASAVLAICGASVIAGLMLAIGSILGAQWKSLAPSDFISTFKAQSPFIQKAVPTIVGPGLIGALGSLYSGWHISIDIRVLWLLHVACLGSVLMATLGWFYPENKRLMSGTIALDALPARLDRWLLWHQVRVVLALTASVLAIIALVRSKVIL